MSQFKDDIFFGKALEFLHNKTILFEEDGNQFIRLPMIDKPYKEFHDINHDPIIPMFRLIDISKGSHDDYFFDIYRMLNEQIRWSFGITYDESDQLIQEFRKHYLNEETK